MNKGLKGLTTSSKQQEYRPGKTKTKEEIRLEQMKIKVQRASLEWDALVIQEQLKSLMNVDRSLPGDPKKDNLIDELNFNNCVCLNRKTTSKFFVGIRKKEFIIHPEFFHANNIFSHLIINNLKHKPNMVQELSRQINISLQKQRFENIVKHQIHHILHITSNNGNTEYCGSTYAKK